MHLRITPLLIILSSIGTTTSLTAPEGESARELSIPEDSDPSHAPSDNLPGCRGMKYHKRDELPRPFPAKSVGKDYEAKLARMRSKSGTYHVKNEAGPRAATCNSQGFAGGYPCQNVDLLSMLDVGELAAALKKRSDDMVNDIWGWTDPSSRREFSIVGMFRGTAFVEITDPYNPIYLGVLPTKTSNSYWRDMKVMDYYALIVSEASRHGMQIFDLERLLTASSGGTVWSEDVHYDKFGRAHNIFVNEDSGFAYAVGTSTCQGGLHMVDVNNPLNPTFAGCFNEDGYVHDVQCIIYDGPDTTYINKEICFCSNENSVTIVDVTVKSNPRILSKTKYNGAQYTHQGWLTEDKAYFIFNDELDEEKGTASKTRTYVLNVKDLNNAFYVDYHAGRTRAIDHNLYVKGDFVYQANYRAGLNILKMKDMTRRVIFEEAGYFDIFPDSNSANFNGAWSTYPYHESGVVTVSGIEQGLFILKFNSGKEPSLPPAPTTSSQTDSPTISPVNAPSSSSSRKDCNDSSLTFEIEWKKKNDDEETTSFRSCSWVGKKPKQTEEKCMLDGISAACPVTCGTCEQICEDTTATFKVEVNNGNRRKKSCDWVRERKTNERCALPGIVDACPETCKWCG